MKKIFFCSKTCKLNAKSHAKFANVNAPLWGNISCQFMPPGGSTGVAWILIFLCCENSQKNIVFKSPYHIIHCHDIEHGMTMS
jgi:hypothetical protein